MHLPCKLISKQAFGETETTEMNYNRQIFFNKTTTASNDVVMATGVKGAFHSTISTQNYILEILVGTSNGTDLFGLVRPEYSGPALKVVHFNRSGYLGRSDRNFPFQ